MAPPRNALFVFHRILIAAAIGLGGALVLWGGAAYLQGGSIQHLLTAVLGGVASLGLSLYLRAFMRKAKGPGP